VVAITNGLVQVRVLMQQTRLIVDLMGAWIDSANALVTVAQRLERATQAVPPP